MRYRGDGGDELFGGYNRYFWGPRVWNRFERLPHPLRRVLGQAISAISLPLWDTAGLAYARLRPGTAGVSRLGDKAHRLGDRLRYVKTNDDLYRSLVSEWPLESGVLAGISAEPLSQLDDPLPESGAEDPALRMMAQDMRSYLPDDILCKVDRAAMGGQPGDPHAVFGPGGYRFVHSLADPHENSRWRGPNGRCDRCFINMSQERLSIDQRQVFPFLSANGLRGPLRDWAEDMLSRDRLGADGLLNPDVVRQTWAEHLSGRRDWTVRLWAVLMFQAWRRVQE